MAIEISAKPKVAKPAGVKIILYSLSAVFFAFVLSYFILFFWHERQEIKLQTLASALNRTPQEAALEKEVLLAKRRLDDFEPLLLEHKFPLKFFEFLERSTHPSVRFLELKLDFNSGRADLSALANNFKIISQQALIFESAEFIKSARVVSASQNHEGGINFDVLLSFDPKELK